MFKLSLDMATGPYADSLGNLCWMILHYIEFRNKTFGTLLSTSDRWRLSDCVTDSLNMLTVHKICPEYFTYMPATETLPLLLKYQSGLWLPYKLYLAKRRHYQLKN